MLQGEEDGRLGTSPSISGDWITFGRGDDESNDEWVLLESSSQLAQLELEKISLRREYLYPGQVNGNFVVWTYCGVECDVRKYEIPSDHIPTQGEIVPETLAKAATATDQYAAAVTSTGAVYLVRSGDGCGIKLRIVRFGSIGPPRGNGHRLDPGRQGRTWGCRLCPRAKRRRRRVLLRSS